MHLRSALHTCFDSFLCVLLIIGSNAVRVMPLHLLLVWVPMIRADTKGFTHIQYGFILSRDVLVNVYTSKNIFLVEMHYAGRMQYLYIRNWTSTMV